LTVGEYHGYPRDASYRLEERSSAAVLWRSSIGRRWKTGYSLSGGERSVEITRASPPKYILLDEPFMGIDPLPWREIEDR
jgi:ABC-type lipopolysaccharide export system ATPase subunit